MAGVTATITLGIDAKLAGSNDLGNAAFKARFDKSISFLPGTDAISKADLLFSDTRTLSASSSEDLDLAGVLATPLGVTIAAAEIVAIYIAAAAGNTNNVIVGGASATQFVGPFGAATHTLAIQPGQFIFLSCQKGWAVTAGSADLLKVANSSSGSAVSYDIMLIGRTVAA